jgi:hypothetical protein
VSAPNTPAVPRFAVGDRVRVVAGTADPDYPDIPLGGWAGVVADVDQAETGPLYLVEWNEETLAATTPVYRRRCQRDDLEHERAWLRDDALEADPGGPVTVEQPARLVPRPLNLDDPADRARHILGVSSDDDLPAVTPEGLRRFHAYLSEQVRFPFAAGLDLGGAIVGSGLQPVMVTRLVPMKDSADRGGKLRVQVAHEEERLEIPLEILQPVPGAAATADLEAYLAWVKQDSPATVEPTGRALHPLVKLGLVVVLLAGLLGTLLEAVPGSHVPAVVGACLLGVLGGLLGARYELMFRMVNRLSPNVVGGLLLGLVLGAGVGAGVGALLAVWFGALLGAMAGTTSSWLLSRVLRRGPGTATLTFLGACLGGGVEAFLSEADAAFSGLWHGMVGGVVAGAVVVLGTLAYLSVVFGGHE